MWSPVPVIPQLRRQRQANLWAWSPCGILTDIPSGESSVGGKRVTGDRQPAHFVSGELEMKRPSAPLCLYFLLWTWNKSKCMDSCCPAALLCCSVLCCPIQSSPDHQWTDLWGLFSWQDLSWLHHKYIQLRGLGIAHLGPKGEVWGRGRWNASF